jgi:LmbE family N-acetylglucosaminyl deacetylase
MKFSHPFSDVFVPDGALEPREALARVTHLCVGAHQDDIEIMAHAGISDCRDIPGKIFGGVVMTDGAGSPRTGPYAGFSDEQMREVRRAEQRRAAQIGHYGIQVQLGHASSAVKQPGDRGVADDLRRIFAGCHPEVVYLHNPADKHDTHVAVLLRCLEAVRTLPPEQRPGRVLGCEVWRDLDWLPDERKIALDAGRHPELALQLLAAFDSQISGGKRYDLAALGRRAANAVFHASHAVDGMAGITWAMDLTPLVERPELPVEDFVLELIGQFQADAGKRLRSLGGQPGARSG